jgi:hypothetical protein
MAHLLFQEWRAANRAAHALEQAVVRATLAMHEGHGHGPTEEERDKARNMRHIADDLFAVSMNAAKSRAKGTGG